MARRKKIKLTGTTKKSTFLFFYQKNYKSGITNFDNNYPTPDNVPEKQEQKKGNVK